MSDKSRNMMVMAAAISMMAGCDVPFSGMEHAMPHLPPQFSGYRPGRAKKNKDPLRFKHKVKERKRKSR